MTYTEERLRDLLRDSRAEHRRAAAGEMTYPSPELEARLVELGRAYEAGEVSDDLKAKVDRGARILDQYPPTSSS